MAAVLKKRALAEYNKNFQDGPPSKKLHLAKKPLIGSSAAAFVGLLEKCKSSDEALQLLLRISDCLQFQESDVEEAIKKLSEHFQSEQDSVVRVKILWLFCDIGLECPGANLNHLIDETIHLIKNETSHKPSLNFDFEISNTGWHLNTCFGYLEINTQKTSQLWKTARRLCGWWTTHSSVSVRRKSVSSRNVSANCKVRAWVSGAERTRPGQLEWTNTQLYPEVRTAAVDAVCQLSLENPVFATTSLDFLVDMFNDEIEDVRLRAIDSLTRIAHHIVLREDQLETILGALEDFSMDVREGLHKMLGACTVASKTCLEMCIDKILENLKRYPQDKRSTYRCVQRLGSSHATLVLPLTTRLLAVHPFFDMPEPDVDDPAYICVLILVLNAAQHCATMLPLFEEHTIKHYTYLRDTMPHLVPYLPIGDAQQSLGERAEPTDDSAVRRFFDCVLQHIDNFTLSTNVRLKMLQCAEEQLTKLSEMEPSVSGAANFTALMVRSARTLHEALEAGAAPPAHALAHLTADCLRLQHQFSGVTEQENAYVLQLALRVCAARLCSGATGPVSGLNWAIAGLGGVTYGAGVTTYGTGVTNYGAGGVSMAAGNAAPSVAAAAALTHHAEILDRVLAAAGVEPDPFTIAVFQQLSLNADNKPAALARSLAPLLHAAPLPVIPRPNLNIRMCTATIIEPASDNDTVLRFCAGLVTSVALEAEV
ncbi:hypothetical protein ACJJTC_010278, partial [Scirpophaga incertulas]